MNDKLTQIQLMMRQSAEQVRDANAQLREYIRDGGDLNADDGRMLSEVIELSIGSEKILHACVAHSKQTIGSRELKMLEDASKAREILQRAIDQKWTRTDEGWFTAEGKHINEFGEVIS